MLTKVRALQHRNVAPNKQDGRIFVMLCSFFDLEFQNHEFEEVQP